jgi:hypothetical protein
VGIPRIEHRGVCLFGDGELSEEIRRLGIHVILDLRPYFRKGEVVWQRDEYCSDLQ